MTKKNIIDIKYNRKIADIEEHKRDNTKRGQRIRKRIVSEKTADGVEFFVEEAMRRIGLS